MIEIVQMEQVINTTFVETLENVGFVETSPINSENIALKKPIAFRLKILMPYLGDVVLVLEHSLGQTILNNTFPGEDGDELINDSVGELLNVFVGKLMDRVYPDKPFKIGIPQKIDPHDFDIEHSFCHTYVDPEGHSVLLYSKLEMSHF